MTTTTFATTAAAMVAAARTQVEELSAEQVARELSDPQVVLIDLRESEERQKSGVIPGAIHAPRGMLEFYADPTSAYHLPAFDPDKRVILHCAAGSRSALAAVALRELGYARVAHLAQGLKGWAEEGRPVETPQSGLI